MRSLNIYFKERLDLLNCDKTTKAYIIGLFAGYKHTNLDFSKESLTLLYSRAKQEQNFLIFQSLGDWLFFCQSMFPEHLNNASADYYYNIGQLSYYSCFKLIDKKWLVYENLSDDFVNLTTETRKIIQKF